MLQQLQSLQTYFRAAKFVHLTHQTQTEVYKEAFGEKIQELLPVFEEMKMIVSVK